MNLRMSLRAFGLAAILGGAALAVGVVSVEATAPSDHKVTICHATASPKNPYIVETVDVASIESFVNGTGHGASGVNAGDIIPPFTYAQDGFTFAGQGSQATLAAGCDTPVTTGGTPTPTPVIGGSPTPTPTSTPVIGGSPTPTPTTSGTVTSPTPTPGVTGTVLGTTATVNPAAGTGSASGTASGSASSAASTTGSGASGAVLGTTALANTGANNLPLDIGLLLVLLGMVAIAATAVTVRRADAS